MALLVDVHCHLDHPDFKDDLDKVIDSARKAGLKAVIACGVNPETNRQVLEFSEKYDIVRAGLGIYPPDALEIELEGSEWTKAAPFDVDKEIDFIRQNKAEVAAIGEVGLDSKNCSRPEEQREIFRKMVRLAKELDKPIIIHSRKAEEDVLRILEEEEAEKVILHCFSGKKRLVEKGIELDFYFSIPANVVKSEQFMWMAERVNINRILTETDAPFLSPFPGERNEPAFVVESVKKIAEIKGMTEEEVANNVFKNYQGLF